jgi:hypothetical protein
MVFSLWLWPTTKSMATKKYTSNTGNFNGHADTVVQCGAHRPTDCICGFMQSHYMLPLGMCPHRIAPATAMVEDFE